jgi:V/A-type H+-transporting ATPase subunit C
MAIRLWLYPYDCNNVKAAIKAFFRGVDARRMMFDFGTVSPQCVTEMVQTGDFEALPASMRQAASEATRAYAKGQNPQVIDLLLDRACFADMAQAASDSGDGFALSMVQTKTDLTNILTAVRLLRMGRDTDSTLAFFKEAMLEGGTLSSQTLNEWMQGGEAYLWSRLYHTPLGWISEQLAGKEKTLTQVERCIDDFLMHQLKGVKFSAFGREVLIAYWLANEYAVKNLRIVLAGHAAGLSPETIRERVRDGYV